jgi:3-hydroxybutyrate dehydrogenase
MLYFAILMNLLMSILISGIMLRGKTAIVTGSTSGIGLAIAKSLAKEGANILVNGLRDDRSVLEELREFNVEVAFHRADMSKPQEIEEMINFAKERFGDIDILVNNAGIQHVSPVEDFPVDKWDAIIAINLSSAFHTTRLVLPRMKEKNWGRIINLASVHGLVGSANKSAYVAAKHGMIGFTKATALETATTGVTVNAICPGWVLTPLVDKQIHDRAARDNISVDDAKVALLHEKQPSLDFVSGEDLGALALFLCSPAGNQVRGVAWNVDGGWVAQ